MKKVKKYAFLAIFTAIAACATHPLTFPNSHIGERIASSEIGFSSYISAQHIPINKFRKIQGEVFKDSRFQTKQSNPFESMGLDYIQIDNRTYVAPRLIRRETLQSAEGDHNPLMKELERVANTERALQKERVTETNPAATAAITNTGDIVVFAADNSQRVLNEWSNKDHTRPQIDTTTDSLGIELLLFPNDFIKLAAYVNLENPSFHKISHSDWWREVGLIADAKDGKGWPYVTNGVELGSSRHQAKVEFAQKSDPVQIAVADILRTIRIISDESNAETSRVWVDDDDGVFNNIIANVVDSDQKQRN